MRLLDPKSLAAIYGKTSSEEAEKEAPVFRKACCNKFAGKNRCADCPKRKAESEDKPSK